VANAPKFRTLRPIGNTAGLDRREKSSSERGYGNYWSTVIAPQVRERDEWLCQECLREGGLGMAMEEMASRPRTKNGATREPIVDHIIPAHAIPRNRFYDLDNLQTLCDRHHSIKTANDLKKYGAAKR
jgi:5-methylcytosine-specific restriction endonuclease McrA